MSTKGCKSWRGQQVSSGAECGGLAALLWGSEHWQVKILFSCKFELKGSICLFPIFYPMSIPSTHCPDRARPTANTPAQSSYYYNLLALYYVLPLNIIISRLNSVRNTNFGLDNKKPFLTHSKIVFVTDNICIKWTFWKTDFFCPKNAFFWQKWQFDPQSSEV